MGAPTLHSTLAPESRGELAAPRPVQGRPRGDAPSTDRERENAAEVDTPQWRPIVSGAESHRRCEWRAQRGEERSVPGQRLLCERPLGCARLHGHIPTLTATRANDNTPRQPPSPNSFANTAISRSNTIPNIHFFLWVKLEVTRLTW